MSGTVKVVAMSVNGLPYTCPECNIPVFTLDAHPTFDMFPADANCFYSHHWTDPTITGETLTMILGSRTGRTKATHDDTFSFTHDGTHYDGTLQPEIVYDDVKQAGKTLWRRGVKPTLRKQKRAAIRAITQPGKQATRKALAAVANTAASAKSTALTAAWTSRAGGYQDDPEYQPAPVIPCGAGCNRGYFTIDSRIHGATKVPCTVCRGTGETL